MITGNWPEDNSIPVSAYWKDTDKLIGHYPTIKKALYELKGRSVLGKSLSQYLKKTDKGKQRTIKDRTGRKFYLRPQTQKEHTHKHDNHNQPGES